jgi:hypothetical protein
MEQQNLVAHQKILREDKQFLAKFKHEFKNKWTVKPKCLIREHEHLKSCQCRKRFVRTAQLREWMAAHGDAVSSRTHAERLLNAVQVIPGTFGKFDKNPKAVIEGGSEQAVLVLSCLIQLGYGDLIGIFHKSDVTDEHLINSDVYHNDLRWHWGHAIAAISERYDTAEIDTIIDQFEKNKWPFCPARFDATTGFAKSLDENVRLPFCMWDSVNETQKGGMASVFQVWIQPEFVPDDVIPRLGPLMEVPGHPGYGEVSLPVSLQYAEAHVLTFPSAIGLLSSGIWKSGGPILNRK